jgi:hypothetical protein
MNEMTDDLLRTVDRLFDSACTREARESAEAGIWPAAMWQGLQHQCPWQKPCWRVAYYVPQGSMCRKAR